MAADLEGNGEYGLVVTAPGLIAAYGADGERRWLCETPIRVSAGSSESRGLPGHDAPGVQVADIDGDGRPELLHLDESSRVHIRSAQTGELIRAVPVKSPEGAERWEHLAVANLRGQGDRDLVLQATNAKGYRVGRYVAAYALEDLAGKPLWATDHFGALAHGPFRLADLDGDGRDEVCGFTILKPDGARTDWVYPPIEKQYAGGASFHIDSLFVADVRGDLPGLEVVLLEEGRNYVGIVSLNQGLLSWTTHGRQEPQNAVVGEFDPARPGLEIWCRSRYDRHQKPWVLDSRGEVDFQLCARRRGAGGLDGQRVGGTLGYSLDRRRGAVGGRQGTSSVRGRLPVRAVDGEVRGAIRRGRGSGLRGGCLGRLAGGDCGGERQSASYLRESGTEPASGSTTTLAGATLSAEQAGLELLFAVGRLPHRRAHSITINFPNRAAGAR